MPTDASNFRDDPQLADLGEAVRRTSPEAVQSKTPGSNYPPAVCGGHLMDDASVEDRQTDSSLGSDEQRRLLANPTTTPLSNALKLNYEYNRGPSASRKVKR